MASAAIICLGNRYVAGDDIGPRLFDHFSELAVPEDVEIIDGGLCGLDLLRSIEGRRRVVFADAVSGLAPTGEITLLSGAQVAAYAGVYGHAAGLPYLLNMLPRVYCQPLPEITLLGVAGEADADLIASLAQRCLELATHGAV